MNRAILHALVSASTFLSPAAGCWRLTLLTARRREDGSIPQIGNMTSVFASMITNIDAQRLHEKSNCHSCSGYSIAGRRSWTRKRPSTSSQSAPGSQSQNWHLANCAACAALRIQHVHRTSRRAHLSQPVVRDACWPQVLLSIKPEESKVAALALGGPFRNMQLSHPSRALCDSVEILILNSMRFFRIHPSWAPANIQRMFWT